MVEITPRWEWRLFGRRFGEAETRLAALTPGGVQESDEIYLLSAAGGNVKVRDALLDIKVLRQVNADGLEQWMPVMKAGFPLPATEAAKVFEALRLPVPSLSRASYTLDELIREFAALGCAIREVKVHKRRTRYTFGGCMAELCDVVANGKSTRTIAIESEDAAGIIRAVKELCLGGYMNTSYPRGLTALIDEEPARYAVIDVGTNSVKLLIGERDRAGKWRTLVDRAELTRLGEGLEQHRVIDDAALVRTAATIAGMADEAKRFRYTERYKLDGAVSLEVLHEAMAAISADLSRIEGRPAPAALVAMGGAVTNITAVKHGLAHYDPTVVQGTVLDLAEVERQIEL